MVGKQIVVENLTTETGPYYCGFKIGTKKMCDFIGLNKYIDFRFCFCTSVRIGLTTSKLLALSLQASLKDDKAARNPLCRFLIL